MIVATPPASPLFPYTTLFRSLRLALLRLLLPRLHAEARVGPLPDRRPGKRGTQNQPRDRKSTRLNSSHANNSYAVFCLKKKIYLGDSAYGVAAAADTYFQKPL